MRSILFAIAVVALILGGKMFLAFLAGTVAFWVIIALSFVLMSYWLDDEEPHGVLTTIGFVATVLLLGMVNKGPFYGFVHNTQLVHLFVIAGFYILAGVVWSFVKWYFFLLKVRDELIEKQG